MPSASSLAILASNLNTRSNVLPSPRRSTSPTSSFHTLSVMWGNYRKIIELILVYQQNVYILLFVLEKCKRKSIQFELFSQFKGFFLLYRTKHLLNVV